MSVDWKKYHGVNFQVLKDKKDKTPEDLEILHDIGLCDPDNCTHCGPDVKNDPFRKPR